MNVIRRGHDGQPREFELTDDEQHMWDERERLLDMGFGLPLAAKLALNRYVAARSSNTDEAAAITLSVPGEFVRWLGDGCVERWGSRFRLTMEARKLTGPAPRKRRSRR